MTPHVRSDNDDNNVEEVPRSAANYYLHILLILITFLVGIIGYFVAAELDSTHRKVDGLDVRMQEVEKRQSGVLATLPLLTKADDQIRLDITNLQAIAFENRSKISELEAEIGFSGRHKSSFITPLKSNQLHSCCNGVCHATAPGVITPLKMHGQEDARK